MVYRTGFAVTASPAAAGNERNCPKQIVHAKPSLPSGVAASFAQHSGQYGAAQWTHARQAKVCPGNPLQPQAVQYIPRPHFNPPPATKPAPRSHHGNAGGSLQTACAPR